MYGYVRPRKSELKMREFLRYRSLYCGLCHSLEEEYGQRARACVNYDLTFLALLARSLQPEEAESREEACFGFLGKKHLTAGRDDDLRYCATVCLLLAAAKMEDDFEDEGEKGRAAAAVKVVWLASAVRRARRAAPQLAAAVDRYLETTRRAELRDRQRCFSRENDIAKNAISFTAPPPEDDPVRFLYPQAALAFSDLMEEVFERLPLPCLPQKAQEFYPKGDAEQLLRTCLRWVARPLARWIYLIDALDDFEEDRKLGRDSFLSSCAGREEAIALTEDLLIRAEEDLDRALALLPFCQDAPILQNIACLGLPFVRREVTEGRVLPKL